MSKVHINCYCFTRSQQCADLDQFITGSNIDMFLFYRHSGYTDDGLVFGEPQDICVTTFTSNPQDQHCYCTNSTTPPLHIIQRKPSGDSGKTDDNKENIPVYVYPAEDA